MVSGGGALRRRGKGLVFVSHAKATAPVVAERHATPTAAPKPAGIADTRPERAPPCGPHGGAIAAIDTVA